MLRRVFIAGMMGAGLTASANVSAQALFRTVVEVNSNDPQQMLRALNIVLETGRYHVAYRESAEIRVIAVGDGLAMLREDISPVRDRVASVSRSLPFVSWYTAVEDVAAVTTATGAAPPLIKGVVMVQEGAAEAERLQADGWSLLRP